MFRSGKGGQIVLSFLLGTVVGNKFFLQKTWIECITLMVRGIKRCSGIGIG